MASKRKGPGAKRSKPKPARAERKGPPRAAVSGDRPRSGDRRRDDEPTAPSRRPSWLTSRPWIWVAAGAILAGVIVWQTYRPSAVSVPDDLTLRIIATHPHDRGAFTQGLLWYEGKLYESAGLYRQSTLRRVDPTTGEIEQSVDIGDEYFAEGLARVGDELIQLTWREGKALVWDLRTFEKLREHDYEGEGWGLCFDGQRLVMSNGSDMLIFRDPRTFERLGSVRVTRAGQPVFRLNELECVEGEVYANIWESENIARIDLETGRVTGWIDASGLLPVEDRQGGEDVLNGIAHDPTTGRLFVTGKRWAHMYEVELVPAP